MSDALKHVLIFLFALIIAVILIETGEFFGLGSMEAVTHITGAF
ncbi:MAG: hypothetical protein WC878_06180 [Candidatus Paceibacterota bacterium]|jgi:hypothetical protein